MRSVQFALRNGVRYMRGIVVSFALVILASAATAQSLPPMPKQPAPANAPAIIAPEPVAMTTVKFDPTQLSIKRVDGRFHLVAGKQFLKDFGPQEREAQEAARLVRDLHFTQYGTIAGSTPAFEYWLGEDGEGQRGGLIVKNVISFNDRTLRVEPTVNAWLIRDDRMVLYNFGADEAAAKQAFAIIKKHGFNQLGVIGAPRPIMTYLTVDPYGRAARTETKTDPRDIINTLAQQGLILPNIGYVGGRLPLESRKIEMVKAQNDWTIVHGRDVLGRFGTNEARARDALHLLQDARITEVVLVGKSGFPIFLANGKAPRPLVLGFGTARLNPAQMKVQSINGSYCITEGSRSVLSFGDNRTDAELVLKVLQHFQFDQMIVTGDPDRGGIRLFSKTK
jgi:hypothetical protein